MKLIKPYLNDLVIGVECLFYWYWIAEFCEDNGLGYLFLAATNMAFL
jgi:hypothetical protein